MKPAFALDFRNDAISLLHRTSGGWHQVGRVTFDEPDLPSALAYLRSTALGLSPRGLATKLILPDDQLLVTEVDAPGPDDASRAAQIRAALEGRTPYPVEELVFDWESVGGTAHVAVVWRETLAEAEAFAVEHRFNPVAFAAAPAAGFVGEPWFGQTALAATLLAPGEVVERDGEAVVALAHIGADAVASGVEKAAQAMPPEAVAVEVEAPEAVEAPVEEPPVEEPFAEDPIAEELIAEERIAEAPLAAPPEEAAEAPPVPQDGWLDEAPAEISAAAPEDLPSLPPLMREQPLFGLADDEPAPSEVFRSRPVEHLLPEDLPAAISEDEGAAAENAAFAPEADAFSPIEEPPADFAAAMEAADAQDEAPMALDVEDEEGSAAIAAAGVTNRAIDDDVPPVPGYSPAMGFASRRASANEPGFAPKLAAPPRPTVARPTAAKPLPAAAPPKAERPMVDRPTAVNSLIPKETKGLRGLQALVTAPGLPGNRKKKAAEAAPAAAPQPDSAAVRPAAPPPAAGKRSGALEKGLGAQRGAVRGKPRYLGLILTVVLLLVLAVIAAWSTSLAFRSDDSDATELAASEVPAPEEEMLADGILPDDMAEDMPAAEASEPVAEASDGTAETAAETGAAPATGEATLAPAPTAPTTSAGGEIVLAAKDPVPEAPAPVDLPEQLAQGDPLPLAQAPPPPFGTVYKFDDKGLIVPTPEGIITPEGVRLVAGKPPRVPPARPEGLAPVTPAPAAEAPGETGMLPTVADPALAGFRPKARPEGLAPAVELNEAPAVSDNRLAGKRPLARPEAVLVAGEAATAATSAAAASLAAEAAPQPETASASPMAVAISRRPEPRPRDLSRAVEAAVAAAVRTPQPQPDPEPEPEQTASLVPKKAPEPPPEPEVKEPKKKTKTVYRGRDGNDEVEADDEPELEAAPKSKSGGSVAKQATFKNALAMDKTALIGVYGTPSKRYAMIRTSGGRYKKVKIGDSIDGGRIQAITANEVRYQKGSRLITLSLPRG